MIDTPPSMAACSLPQPASLTLELTPVFFCAFLVLKKALFFVTFVIYSSHKNAICFLEIMDSLQFASSSLEDDSKIIRGWIQKCVEDHEGTSCTKPAPDFNPKRLIYLSSDGSTTRLVDTPIPKPQYVALSYVWGPSEENTKTERNNLDQMYEAIPLNCLPRTLRNVFGVVKSTGIEYLWIDALCIVQDDDVEMSGEIKRMGYIYWNAYLVLTAMSSRGANQGLYSNRREYEGDDIDWHHKIMRSCRSLPQMTWDGPISQDYPLLTRGWTFQERILARRCVHFTAHELVWECKEERLCQCGNIGSGMTVMKEPNLINNMSAAFETCVNLKTYDPSKVIPMWRECVMSYSRRRLSEPKDRLVAISGISGMLRGDAGAEQYVAGMWKDVLPFELLWRCDQTSQLPLKKIFQPSWSWCSVHCGVDWPVLPPTKVDNTLRYIPTNTYFEQNLSGKRAIVSHVEIQPQNAGFGRVTSGRIVLRARVINVIFEKHADPESWKEQHLTEWIIQDNYGSRLPFYPDINQNTLEYTKGYSHEKGSPQRGLKFVEIASEVQGDRMWQAGLVVGGGKGFYERLGMAGYITCEPVACKRDWFEWADYEQITLQ
jgi:hypothetical protein